MFGGIQMIVSPFALKDSDVRLFPESKNRSARILKKLVKRFGGEFKKVPAIWQIEDRLIVHPALMHTVRQAIAESRKELRLPIHTMSVSLRRLCQPEAPTGGTSCRSTSLCGHRCRSTFWRDA
jgi:hypothetical protein